MGVKINTTELKKILEITPSEQNIMLVGKHGIGKSQIIQDYFTKEGLKVVILFLGQMSDPGDLIGLPHKNEKSGHTEFIPPFWFPLDDTPIVLFLDELNRARPEILQSVMDLTLNKRLAGRSLPKGSRVISAVNFGDEYQLSDLDPALTSRFNIYEFAPSIEEWLLWADSAKIDSRIIDFITENPELLDTQEEIEDFGLDKFPDRRAWVRVSSIIKEIEDISSDIYKKAICGIVGIRAGVKFVETYKGNKFISASEILLHFAKVQKKLSKYKTPDFAKINDSLFRYIENKNYQESEAQEIAKNFELYFDYLQKKKANEVLGHFTNLFVSQTYPKVASFVMIHTPSLQQKIIGFVSSL